MIDPLDQHKFLFGQASIEERGWSVKQEKASTDMAQATRLLDEMPRMAGLEVLLSPERHPGQEKTRRYNLEEEDFAALAAVLGSIRGKLVLSLGDHPVMRKLFTSFKCEVLTTKYSTMRKEEGRAEPKQELLISNF